MMNQAVAVVDCIRIIVIQETAPFPPSTWRGLWQPSHTQMMSENSYYGPRRAGGFNVMTCQRWRWPDALRRGPNRNADTDFLRRARSLLGDIPGESPG